MYSKLYSYLFVLLIVCSTAKAQTAATDVQAKDNSIRNGYQHFGQWVLNIDNGVISPEYTSYVLPNRRNVPFDVPFVLKVVGSNAKNITDIQIGFTELPRGVNWSTDNDTSLCCNKCERNPCVAHWHGNAGDSIYLTMPPLDPIKNYKLCIKVQTKPSDLKVTMISRVIKAKTEEKLIQLLDKSIQFSSVPKQEADLAAFTEITDNVLEARISTPLKFYLKEMIESNLCKYNDMESKCAPKSICNETDSCCNDPNLSSYVNWLSVDRLILDDTCIRKAIKEYNTNVRNYTQAVNDLSKFIKKYSYLINPYYSNKGIDTISLFSEDTKGNFASPNYVLTLNDTTVGAAIRAIQWQIELRETDIYATKAEMERTEKKISRDGKARADTEAKIEAENSKPEPNEKLKQKWIAQVDSLDSLTRLYEGYLFYYKLDTSVFSEEVKGYKRLINEVKNLPELMEAIELSANEARRVFRNLKVNSIVSQIFDTSGYSPLQVISSALLTINTTGSFKSRADWHIVPDVGLAYVFGNKTNKPADFVPYYGLQFHVAPINKQIPFTIFRPNLTKGNAAKNFGQFLAYSLSLNVGVTILPITKNEHDGVLGKFGFMAGGGLRLYDFLRVNGGVLVSSQKDANPLLKNAYNTKANGYISLSLDIDLQEYIENLITAVNAKKLIPNP